MIMITAEIVRKKPLVDLAKLDTMPSNVRKILEVRDVQEEVWRLPRPLSTDIWGLIATDMMRREARINLDELPNSIDHSILLRLPDPVLKALGSTVFRS